MIWFRSRTKERETRHWHRVYRIGKLKLLVTLTLAAVMTIEGRRFLLIEYNSGVIGGSHSQVTPGFHRSQSGVAGFALDAKFENTLRGPEKYT